MGNPGKNKSLKSSKYVVSQSQVPCILRPWDYVFRTFETFIFTREVNLDFLKYITALALALLGLEKIVEEQKNISGNVTTYHRIQTVHTLID